MKRQDGFTAVEMFVLFVYGVLLPAGIFGWGWNIYKLVHADFNVLSGMLIVRIIGIPVAPLGAVIGYF